jgi:hypothetical protein
MARTHLSPAEWPTHGQDNKQHNNATRVINWSGPILFVSTFYTQVEKVLTKIKNVMKRKIKIIKPTTPLNSKYVIMSICNKSGTPTVIDCFKMKVSQLSIVVWFIRRICVEILRFEQILKIGFPCVLMHGRN